MQPETRAVDLTRVTINCRCNAENLGLTDGCRARINGQRQAKQEGSRHNFNTTELPLPIVGPASANASTMSDGAQTGPFISVQKGPHTLLLVPVFYGQDCLALRQPSESSLRRVDPTVAFTVVPGDHPHLVAQYGPIMM